LADLNLVLETLLHTSPHRPLGGKLQPSFNHIGLPPQFNCGGFQQSPPWNQPTKQSCAWKMNAKKSQSRRLPYIASRKEYVPRHPKSHVPHQSTSQQTPSNNIWPDHLYKPTNSLQNTSPVLPEHDHCSRDCQQNKDHNQSPLEAPENKDTNSESKNGTDVQSNSTDCPASPADTIEDLTNEPGKNSLDTIIDHDKQPNDQSNLVIDLGPEASEPISFEPVPEPEIWNDQSDIIFDTEPTTQPPELNTTSSEMINPVVPIVKFSPNPFLAVSSQFQFFICMSNLPTTIFHLHTHL
jgi:hypothetical protein